MFLDHMIGWISWSNSHDLCCPDDAHEPDEVYIGRLAAFTTLYSLAEGVVTYPYDLVKTRQQVAMAGSPASRLTTLAHVTTLCEEQGLQALYRGFRWNVLGGVPSEVAYYVGYTKAKAAMLSTPVGRRNPSAVYLIAGAMADVISVLLWVPADVISQRLMIIGAHNPESLCSCALPTHTEPRISSPPRVLSTCTPMHPHTRLLTSTAAPPDAVCTSTAGRPTPPPTAAPLSSAEATDSQVVRRLVARDGLQGLWRGAMVTMASYAPHSAVWWLTHEQTKLRISRKLGKSEENACVLALSGSMAGFVSTLTTNPLDVVKTRFQCSEGPTTAMGIFRDILAGSGWRELYSGLAPRLLGAIPRSICAVLAYEKAIDLCRK